MIKCFRVLMALMTVSVFVHSGPVSANVGEPKAQAELFTRDDINRLVHQHQLSPAHVRDVSAEEFVSLQRATPRQRIALLGTVTFVVCIASVCGLIATEAHQAYCQKSLWRGVGCTLNPGSN